MKTINRLSGVLFLLVITITLSAQSGTESAILCGKVLFEPDSIYPLKPYSIIVEKDWPITFSQFEQQRIDTTDYSFSIRMEPEELTYGNIIINFFSDVDTISKEERGHWMSSQRPDIFVNSDGMITEYASRILFTGLKFVLEPGDSLHMLIDYNKKDINGRASVHFSGSGSANNKLCRSMSVFGLDSKSFRLPLKEGLSYEDDELAGEMKDLYQAKDSISEAYFRLLHTDMLFDNLSAKHALIRASLYGSDISIEEKRAIARSQYSFLDTLTDLLKLVGQLLHRDEFGEPEYGGFNDDFLVSHLVTLLDFALDLAPFNALLAQGADHVINVFFADFSFRPLNGHRADVQRIDFRKHLDHCDKFQIAFIVVSRFRFQARRRGGTQILVLDRLLQTRLNRFILDIGSGLLAKALLDDAHWHATRAEALDANRLAELT